ncbi:MAG: TIGR02186 family protein, partial [Thermodesulfovibrionia bacterium]|nr:TIGR02186 family protein [Thermodesulfovibrionia bacterium]
MKKIIPNKSGQISNFKFSIFLLSCLLILAGTASAELTINANHNHIKIDFFYHGSTVSVKGTSDPDTDLIIKITSPEGHEVLKQKGKIAGLLWMNTGTLKFENISNLYSIHST